MKGSRYSRPGARWKMTQTLLPPALTACGLKTSPLCWAVTNQHRGVHEKQLARDRHAGREHVVPRPNVRGAEAAPRSSSRKAMGSVTARSGGRVPARAHAISAKQDSTATSTELDRTSILRISDNGLPPHTGRLAETRRHRIRSEALSGRRSGPCWLPPSSGHPACGSRRRGQGPGPGPRHRPRISPDVLRSWHRHRRH